MARKKGTRTARAEAAPTVEIEAAPPGTLAWLALAVFGVALLVRLVHLWQIRRAPFFSLLMGDSRGYDEWARRIAAGDWIGSEVFYQAPLYPYFLGVLYAVAGRHLLLVRIVQALIGSASCALLALAAARFFAERGPSRRAGERASTPGRWAGIVAGLILALYAPAIFFDGLLQKSVLDVFFVCLALWLISTTINAEPAEPAETHNPSLRVPRVPRLTSWLWLGLTMGALALTRENALVFIVVILGWIVVNAERRTPNVERLKRGALFLAGLAIVLVPVAARNHYVGGGFYVTTSQFGPNLFIGNNAGADGTYQSLRFGRGAPEYERQDATELAEKALGRTLTPAEVSGYWTDRSMEFITGRPGAWLTLMGRKIALLWNATEMLDTESQETYAEWSLPLRIGGFVGHFGILVPLALFGVIVTWPMRSRLWILYAMTLAYAASVVLFYVFARYRYPLVPLLILFAAAGVAHLIAWAGRKAGPYNGLAVPGTWWTVGAIAAVAVFCNWPILSAALMRAVTETNLGATLQAEGRVDEAIDHYHRANALAPDYPPAYNNLATALRAKGQLTEAVATYQQAIRLRPEYPEAQYNLANALMDAGKPADAVEHFRVALASIPGSVDVHNNLGIALMGEGKRDQAIDEFRAALQIDPSSVKSLVNLAGALGSARKYDEALQHYRRAIQIEPANASTHYDLGSMLLEMDRTEEAIAEFRAALQADPKSVAAHNNLGIALGSQGRFEAAIDQFQQALALKPDDADARQNLAIALRVRGRTKD